MQKYPSARAGDFEHLLEVASLHDRPLHILDIPSGGGYLRSYLPEKIHLVSVDPADRFLFAGPHEREEKPVCAKHDDLPFSNASFDVVLSLAGMHHIENQASVFQEWNRILKPHGTLVVGDVAKDSTTHHFLDTVVDRFNTMGHRGNYFTPQVDTLVSGCGFVPETLKEISYTWDFEGVREMLDFCRILFGMDRNPADEELLEGINHTVGYFEDDQGAHLNWSLLFIRCKAKP